MSVVRKEGSTADSYDVPSQAATKCARGCMAYIFQSLTSISTAGGAANLPANCA
jgi:hypothetical protein